MHAQRQLEERVAQQNHVYAFPAARKRNGSDSCQYIHMTWCSKLYPAHNSDPRSLPTFSLESDTTEDDHDKSKLLKRDLLGRRTHYEANCRYIAARRNNLYKEIPINLLIPLAFHTTPTLLESSQDINALVQAVSDRYKSDLFSDWQRYCKAFDSEQQAVATFGKLILILSIILTFRRGCNTLCGRKYSRVKGARRLKFLMPYSPAGCAAWIGI